MVEDFRTRTLPIWLLIIMVVGVIALALSEVGYKRFLINLGFNIGFLSIQLLALTLYYSVKRKQIVNIVNEYIGLGDIIFYVSCCCLFSPANFIFFQILSLSIILLVYGVMLLFKKTISSTIPLAGGLALIVNVLILTRLVGFDIDFYDDLTLLQLLM